MFFGHLEVTDDAPEAERPIIGANIVGFVRPDSPWVIRYQEIRLTHMGLANKPMRSYEPFFLNQNELAEHGRWLFGGLHVFVPTRRDVTVDVLVAWFAELMPET